ncbi:MAG TPA: Cys-tRNA(Pro) deacylase [Deltaproteobacteria bacterium]|jgi:Cys-tRNA(Pro) deacylase|nr:Cys-tRNA(Pro) deacylase [Deltaproteobacteria bacterium]HOI07627.1 Cys-tRNA(Pro) deacylase [Deltaproteobacteria bacterium]
MSKVEHPITQAVRFLRANSIPFTPRLYPYEDHGGTGRASEMLGVPEHRVIKTLVMESDAKHPFIVLMHGDREVSTKGLARQLGVKQVHPCDMKDAERLTGYQVGGISPFGTRTRLRVYVESTILELDRIYINCGKRGFLAELDPADLEKALKPERVAVAITP